MTFKPGTEVKSVDVAMEDSALSPALPPSSRSRRMPAFVLVMLSVYVLWLCWLGTVAWVNVSAGNQ